MGRAVRPFTSHSRKLAGLMLVVLPVAKLVFDVVDNLERPDGLPDFRIYRHAGAAVLHGYSPYVSPQNIHSVATAGFVYPAPAAWAMAPFALLGFELAAIVFAVIATAAVIASLRLLGVEDLRCYGAALYVMPVSTAITTGTVSTLLVCAAALVWRYRTRVVVPALALAAALMLKPLLWPLVIWLVATRRWRTAAVSAAAACVGTTAAYAALHIDGIRSYPELVRAATAGEGADSYSVYGILARLDLPAPTAVAYAIGAALLVGIWLLARRNERLAFVAAILATLALAPILWVNSFALLLIPLAFASRRLSWLWAAPAAMWFVDAKAFDAPLVSILLVWTLAALTLGAVRAQEAPSVRSTSYVKRSAGSRSWSRMFSFGAWAREPT